jgi:hypothetical protein
VEVTSETGQTLFAVDASDFQLKESITFSAPDENEKLYSILFPFSLHFTSVNDEYVKPRIEFTGFAYLISAVLLLLGYILTRRYQKKSIPFWTAALILLTGTFGLLASITIGNTEEN